MPHALPLLPYAYGALEPTIDELTMRLHHDKHHAGHVAGLNAALDGTAWADRPVEEVLADLALVARPSSAGAAPVVRVVVADGQALVRAGLRALLQAGGHVRVVGEASTGEEVVALVGRLRPDVVLLDGALPGLDSAEATGRIMAEAPTAVTLLIATEQDHRIFAALRAGARGPLLADTEPAELVRAIGLLARGDVVVAPRVMRRLIAELGSVPDPQRPRADLLDELTEREREVVALVAQGLSNADIAERLVISPATSRTHVGRAMLKLGVGNRARLVTFAFDAGLAVPRAAA